MPLVRWHFSDYDELLPDWTFPINPQAMDAPELSENYAVGILDINGEPQDAPMALQSGSWTFNGVLYTLADHDALEGYLSNARPIHVHDHFDRTWRIMLNSVDTTRAGTRRFPQKHKYTARATMLARVA